MSSTQVQPPTESAPDDLLSRLPDGVIELAAEYARSAASGIGGGLSGDQPSRTALVDLLTAPLRLDHAWPEPAPPFPVAGGWVHVEVTDEDRPTFEAVADQWQAHDPEQFAAACQELRLPVSPYRSPTQAQQWKGLGWGDTAAASEPTPNESSDQTANQRELDGALVLDLTTHWAGPLSTKLLAEAGATVIKIDPECRPDGFRNRPELYQHLNGSKQIVDLDLRRAEDRSRFESLLGDADLLVESFSPRVMGNLGYEPQQLVAEVPTLATLSIRAFPADSPQQHWLAFGPGVHAASGLGWSRTSPTGPPSPTPVAYPDLLAGLAVFAVATRLVTGPQRSTGRAAEVSLAGSIAPLVPGSATFSDVAADSASVPRP